MSNASKRDEGAAAELGGKIQEGLGKLVGSERIEAEGKARKLKGQDQKEAAKAAERAKGKTEEVAGAVKNRVGAFIGDEELEAEGRVKELKGELRQHSNR